MFIYILFLLIGTAFDAQQLDPVEAPQSAVVHNKTDEELEAYLNWPKYKENLDKMTPRRRRASLISSYAFKTIRETLKSKSNGEGVLWEFKPDRGNSQEFFALNGNLGNTWVVDSLVYDFLDKYKLKDEKNPDAEKDNLEDLPTTGQIDALNQQIKDLPKKRMSFTKSLWMMNPGVHLLTIHVRVEVVQKLMDVLVSVIGCFVAFERYPWREFEIMHIIGFPVIIPSVLLWISLSFLDSVLISFKVLYYFLTRNLYVVDAKGIKLLEEA